MACGCNQTSAIGMTAAELNALRASGATPMPHYQVTHPDGTTVLFPLYAEAMLDRAANGGEVSEVR